MARVAFVMAFFGGHQVRCPCQPCTCCRHLLASLLPAPAGFWKAHHRPFISLASCHAVVKTQPCAAQVAFFLNELCRALAGLVAHGDEARHVLRAPALPALHRAAQAAQVGVRLLEHGVRQCMRAFGAQPAVLGAQQHVLAWIVWWMSGTYPRIGCVPHHWWPLQSRIQPRS